MGHELQLTFFGKYTVKRNGTLITELRRKKSVALLAYLATSRRTHRRETLAGLLWGETTDANARAALRKALSDLRRSVAPYVNITREAVSFDVTQPYWLDVQRFEQQANPALSAQDQAAMLSDTDTAALTAAVELYRGDFLANFYVRQAPAFESWVLVERERLRLLALRALYVLAAYHSAHGAYSEAIAYTERLLTMAPEQEEAHRQMMLLLALSGQPGAAMHQYHSSRQVLAEEWGVEPDVETTALYERIRDGEQPSVRAPVPQHNLPTTTTPLIGRETELAEIVTRLQEPACHLLTLIGPGGSGKTHLALEAAHLLFRAQRCVPQGCGTQFKDGVHWVALAPLDSTHAIISALARSLSLRFHTERDPLQQLLDYVRQKQLLLVFDNFEHLLQAAEAGELDGADVVHTLLQAAPDVKILVTSRIKLNLQSEYLYPVAGMDYPDANAVATKTEAEREAINRYSAIQLFLSGARRLQPNLALSPADEVAVVRICHIAAGMPLAILLAASWVRVLTPGEIAARLSTGMLSYANEGDHGLDLLETDWRDLPARQRSMRTVFDYSWALLSVREREVLAALSVFRGNFTHAAAKAVTGVSLRELLALADQSLLHRVSLGRYAMHALLRQYAGESGMLEKVRDQHSAYFAGRLQAWAADLKGHRQQAAVAEIDADIMDARAAWDWAVAQEDVTQINAAMEGLGMFYEWRKRYAEGASACRAVVARFTSDAIAQDEDQAHIQALVAKALAWESRFVPDQTQQRLEESLEILDSLTGSAYDTRAARAFVLHRLGQFLCLVDYAQAQDVYERSLTLYQTLGDRWGEANVLNDLGELLMWNRAAYAEAQTFHEQSLDLYRKLGDQKGTARALGHLGALALFQGQKEGEQLVRESIALYREIGERASMEDSFYAAGAAFIALGAYPEAHTLLDENLALSRGLDSRCDSVMVLQSDVKLHLGRYAQARAQAESGLHLARETGDTVNVGFALFVLGCEALTRNAYSEAQAIHQESAAACQAGGQMDIASCALACSGYADLGQKDIVQAKQHLLQALQIAMGLDSLLGLVFVLSGIALLFASFEQTERAIEVYTLASRYPTVANSRWFADVVGRPINAVAATLSPDVIAAAEARGRARDMDGTVAELLVELSAPIAINNPHHH